MKITITKKQARKFAKDLFEMPHRYLVLYNNELMVISWRSEIWRKFNR